MKKQYWEEILIALSLSNLLLISGWRKLIYPNSNIYHIKYGPSFFDYLSIIVIVILLSIIFISFVWLVRYFCKNETPLFVKITFSFLFLVSLNSFRIAFYEYQLAFIGFIGKTYFLSITFIIGILGLILIYKLRGRVFTIIRTLLLALFAFVLLTFSQAILGMMNSPKNLETSDFERIPSTKKTDTSLIKSRVVWIIFDELDYTVGFEKRPSHIKLPAFDYLKEESLYSTNSKSPSRDTLESIPSLLTGKDVKLSVPISKNDLLLNFKDGESNNFSEALTVFDEVKKLGGNSVVAGWYHPYCRTIANSLSGCHWEGDFTTDFYSQSLFQSLTRDTINLLASVPFGYRLFVRFKDSRVDLYKERHDRMMSNSFAFVQDSNVDLVFLHLPFPHIPFFYDKNSDKFVESGTYLDNLVLSDKILGDVRKKLEAQNLWNDSTVIVSADHPLRVKQFLNNLSDEELALTQGIEDSRIPFFVKLKNQNESVKYEKPFNTIITSELILDIMKGEITTSFELTKWMDENGKYPSQANSHN